MKLALVRTIALGVFFGGIVAAADAAPNNLVTAVARRTNVADDKAEETVNTVFSALTSELEGGRAVTVRNFGRFHIADVAPRKGRNPRTGEPLAIPAKRYARFAAADELRLRVNGGEEKKAQKIASAEPSAAPTDKEAH